jgi:hypothetical protein
VIDISSQSSIHKKRTRRLLGGSSLLELDNTIGDDDDKVRSQG